MRIKHKLFLSIMGLSAIIIIMSGLTIFVTNRQKDDGFVINLAGRQRMLNQMIINEVHIYAMTLMNGQKNQMIADSMRQKAQIFTQTLNALKDSGRIPLSLDQANKDYRDCPKAEEPVFSQLEKVRELWNPFVNHIETILGSDSSPEPEINWIMNNNSSLVAAMDKAIDMLQAQSENKIRNLILYQVLFVFMGLLFTFFSLSTVLTVLKRLSKIRWFAKQLGSGDLTVNSGFVSNDELGQIGSDLDIMIGNLRNMIESIYKDTEQLLVSSDALSSVSRTMAGEAKSVSTLSGSVAGAANEMSSNMRVVAKAISNASANIISVASSSDGIIRTIEEVAVNTDKARYMTKNAVIEAEEATSKVNELGEAAVEIGKVTETITEISEQTNLLALNATIEAARAGEAGKGFSVVANEIKELARQTSEATHEIKQKIERIQSSTRESVEKINRISSANNQVNDIVSVIAGKVEEQSDATKEITNNVLLASQGAQDVASSSSQASIASSEVAGDIHKVNQAAALLFTNSTDVSGNADELRTIASNLRNRVNHFIIR